MGNYGPVCDYLYYTPDFTAYTDNNPLTNIVASAKLSAKSLSWIGETADVRFQIIYCLGKSNQ